MLKENGVIVNVKLIFYRTFVMILLTFVKENRGAAPVSWEKIKEKK